MSEKFQLKGGGISEPGSDIPPNGRDMRSEFLSEKQKERRMIPWT